MFVFGVAIGVALAAVLFFHVFLTSNELEKVTKELREEVEAYYIKMREREAPPEKETRKGRKHDDEDDV